MFQYQCYDSECDMKFNNPMERKEHCIEIHKFPKKYRFDDTSLYKKGKESDKMEIDGVDKNQKTTEIILNKNQKSKMFIRATSKINENTIDAKKIPSTEVKFKSALSFVPRQVQKSFTKALTNNQSRERNVLESDNMMELASSLPN